ncbi:alpha/beta hydrolase family protein [Nonomuraea wenchangensis]|uniref:alpha/beta hydrolase family protein n=1 Tax=Nonomuraea wenchangensis TaxID=568860 RepID=UPI001FEA19B6|nr:alpha/beta fold hydrolase [Nonomuraea wenchangensis]
MADPLITDPLDLPGPRAATVPLTIGSAGTPLPGVLHVPAGPGPHPVLILLHGFPGNERNFDLAHAARRAGYASLVFHYRGSWGAGGSWSWAHVLEDAAAAVTATRDPATVAAWRLDPDRLAVVGHSAGGFAALMTAAALPSVAAAGRSRASTSGRWPPPAAPTPPSPPPTSRRGGTSYCRSPAPAPRTWWPRCWRPATPTA